MAKKSLNIALVFDDSLDRPDGVQQHLKTLAAWLVEQGNKVSFVCGQTTSQQPEGVEVFSLAKNLRIKANQNSLSLPLPVAKRSIRLILDRKGFDIIHLMLPFSPWFGGRVVNEALSRGMPLIGTFHTYPATTSQRAGSRLYGLLYGRKLKRFNQLISVSKATQTSVRELFGVQSIVLPNFIDIEHRRLGVKAKNQSQSIVFLGRMVERKGPQHLIEALGMLKAEGKLDNVRVKLGGPGPLLPQLRKRAAELDLNSQVDFPGFIDEEVKMHFLDADLSVFPSTGGEAFGISLLEAMAANTLVLGGDNPGYRTILGSQPKLLVDPTDIVALSSRIDELLNNTKLRHQLLKWQADQLTQYNVRVVGPRVIAVYHEALAL